MNCFVVYVNTSSGERYLRVDSLDADVVKCRQWDGESKSFSIEMEQPLRNLIDAKVGIIHHYGLTKIEFTGAWDFCWNRYTAFVYMQIGVNRAWQTVLQFFFNRRTLRSQRRLDILRLLVSRRLSKMTLGTSLPMTQE